MMNGGESPRWCDAYLAKMLRKHDDFPSPRVWFDNAHPLSIGFGMCVGETHIMAFHHYWNSTDRTIDRRVEYVRQWPPRWMGWMSEAIVDLKLWEADDFCSDQDD